MCIECYIEQSRATPLLNPLDCLMNHMQYICGTCGRCICVEHNIKNGLQRWNFPFKSLEIAKMYLRVADYAMKRPCGIYKIKNKSGRCSYKIFADNKDLESYLDKNKNMICVDTKPVFIVKKYSEYKNTQIRKLTPHEIRKYIQEKNF